MGELYCIWIHRHCITKSGALTRLHDDDITNYTRPSWWLSSFGAH